MNKTRTVELLLWLALAVTPVAAQEKPAPTNDAPASAPAKPAAVPTPVPARTTLPQNHHDQKVLYKFMAALTEKDFEHGVTEKISVPPPGSDLEQQYRDHIYALLQQPHVGGKRGIGAVNGPSSNFLLSTIEGQTAVVVPPVWVEAMASFIQWNSPGNLYRDNKALKMRAFVTASVLMMMLDDHLEQNPGAGFARADWMGYHLVIFASGYPVFKGMLPAEVQEAYEAGLLRIGQRVLAMGPKGGECDYEMSAAVGLWYVATATADALFTKDAEAYARRLCTDPKFLHPAGYWNEGGGFDLGFGGMANFWTVWLALASDWPFAKEAVERVYRLRAHLTLPEPDGKRTGPSAFNNRLGSPVSEDQWDWDTAREFGAAMLTDEAMHMIKIPAAEDLASAVKRRTDVFNEHLYGALKNAPFMYPDGKRYLADVPNSGRYLRNEEIRGNRWAFRIFWNGSNYPVEVNPSHEFYRHGAYAHLAELQVKNSPMLKPPYLRAGTFIKDFGGSLIVAKRSKFAAILHVGPVGDPAPAEPMAFFEGPLGFGGGQLSAFWTAEAGSALLARRAGLMMAGTECRRFDKIEDWRNWPIHAVSGVTGDGKFFTSARIARPKVVSDVKADQADVIVSGAIPATIPGQEGGPHGQLSYSRKFHVDDKGVRVETTVTGDGKDTIAELYETLPVYNRDIRAQPKAGPAVVEFQAAGKWVPADATWVEKVKAVRIRRFQGAVVVTFDSPRRVKLSPADWADTFLSKASCRNVLIDLLETGDKPSTVKNAKSVAYLVEAVGG